MADDQEPGADLYANSKTWDVGWCLDIDDKQYQTWTYS